MTREEIIKAVETEIRKYSIWAEVYEHPAIKCVIQADVQGDWKHDHLATDQIFRENGCTLLSEINVVSDGSDCYESTHNYIINS